MNIFEKENCSQVINLRYRDQALFFEEKISQQKIIKKKKKIANSKRFSKNKHKKINSLKA